jgi:hypothetical protein
MKRMKEETRKDLETVTEMSRKMTTTTKVVMEEKEENRLKHQRESRKSEA